MSLAHTLQPVQPAAPSSYNFLTPEQHVVRAALYLTLAPLNAAHNISSAFKESLAAQLLPSLRQTDLSNMWFPCLDLFLWVLCTTAWVFDGEDDEIFEWIVGHVARVTKALGITTRTQLVDLLRGFVYPRRQVGTTVERLWERISEV